MAKKDKKTDALKGETRSLPLGEERDSLRRGAEDVLGKGTPAPIYGRGYSKVRPWMEGDDDLPLSRRDPFDDLDRSPTGQRRQRDDARVMRERAERVERPFWRSQTEGSDSSYVKLAGRSFTKQELFEVINQDLPRLIREAHAEETQRGKLMRGILIPALTEELIALGYVLRRKTAECPACKGSGVNGEPEGQLPCPSCGGSGKARLR